MGDGQGHGCQPLGCRVHHYHGVLLPRLASRLVPNTSPQVDDFFAMTVHAARPANFLSTGEVLDKRISHGLEALADASLNSSVRDYPSPSIGRRSERKLLPLRSSRLARGQARDVSSASKTFASKSQ